MRAFSSLWKLLSARAPAGARVLTGYRPKPASAASPALPAVLLGKREVKTFFRAALKAFSRIFTPDSDAAAHMTSALPSHRLARAFI